VVIFAVGALAAAMIVGGAFLSSIGPPSRWFGWDGDVVGYAIMWLGVVLAVLLIGYMFGRGMAD
jgi:hypothetical protein